METNIVKSDPGIVSLINEAGALFSDIRTIANLVNAVRTSSDEAVVIEMDSIAIKRAMTAINNLAERGELLIGDYKYGKSGHL